MITTAINKSKNKINIFSHMDLLPGQKISLAAKLRFIVIVLHSRSQTQDNCKVRSPGILQVQIYH